MQEEKKVQKKTVNKISSNTKKEEVVEKIIADDCIKEEPKVEREILHLRKKVDSGFFKISAGEIIGLGLQSDNWVIEADIHNKKCYVISEKFFKSL